MENTKHVKEFSSLSSARAQNCLWHKIITTSVPEIARRSKIFSNSNRKEQIYIQEKYIQNVVVELSAFHFLWCTKFQENFAE